ncbi:MAG: hypothetical protein EBR38_04185 [Flavobacteriaceae bacterium]|nr:hypothetical protein [Flavobacteriaceae bacterium]
MISIQSLQKFIKLFVLILFLFLQTNFTFAQNNISVPFSNGFVGDNTANNVSSNSRYLNSLGWTNVQFTQNSPQFIFVAQGNDIPGTVLITDFSGIQHSIPGFIKWRAPSGNNITTPVFVPTSGASLATNSSNGSATYNITTLTYIGLTFNGQTLPIPTSSTPGEVTGNAATSGILDALNAYLASFPSISINDYTVNENVGSLLITVSLSASSSQNITVNFSTSNNTATNGSDYTTITGTLTFLAGQTSASFSIQIIDDLTFEPTETFNITLSNSINASILDGSGIVTILDNDNCTLSTPTGSVTAQPTCATTTGTIVFTTQSGVEYSINGTTYQASPTFTGVAAGNYTLKVRSTSDNTCTTTGSTVTVFIPLCAITDTFGPVNGYTGATTASVLTNDTLNGVPVVPSQVVLSGVTVPNGFTLNPNGTITIAPGTPAGNYSVTYRICEVLNPTNCDTATVTITVGSCLDFASNDCDQDGESNGTEVLNGTNPGDACSYTNTPPISSAVYATWSVLDCDGDGVTNGQEIIDGTNPKNPCESNPINITMPLSAAFLNGDCDNDGLSNGDEMGDNINNPNDSNGNGIPDYLEVNNNSPSEDDLEVFNAVTPNSNGENDVFVIRNIQNFPDNNLTIFNRWGVLVYEADGYGQNGKFFKGISEGRITIKKDDQLPIGTYFYILRYTNNGNTKERSGYLYLNR